MDSRQALVSLAKARDTAKKLGELMSNQQNGSEILSELDKELEEIGAALAATPCPVCGNPRNITEACDNHE